MINVNVKVRGSIIIIHIKGVFDIGGISNIEKIWDEQVSKKPEIIAMDCKELDRIDSAAIGTLVKIFNNATQKGIKLIFYDLGDNIMNLFETAKLNNFFTITTEEKFESEYLSD